MVIVKHKKVSLDSNQVNEFLNKSYLNSRGAYILFVLMWRLEGFTRLNGKFVLPWALDIRVCDLLLSRRNVCIVSALGPIVYPSTTCQRK